MLTEPDADPGRSLTAERLATAAAPAAARNLQDLSRINRWLGGHRVLGALLAENAGREERFSLLDVGAASGDMGRSVRRGFPKAHVVSLDCRHGHLKLGKGRRVVGDGFRLPFRPRSFDFVSCSLLLHEYDDAAALQLMRQLRSVARRALIVLDLYRHPLAAGFLPATKWIFRWGDLTVHDGPASVRAAFRRHEFRAMARQAGFEEAEVRRHLPWFRISLVGRVEDGDHGEGEGGISGC